MSWITIARQKNTYDRTTTFFRQGASAGAVGSTQAVWNDQRETEPSVMESELEGRHMDRRVGRPIRRNVVLDGFVRVQDMPSGQRPFVTTHGICPFRDSSPDHDDYIAAGLPVYSADKVSRYAITSSTSLAL